jgi:methionine salvage enolase-phosphatase E1
LGDLKAAKGCGLKTILVQREREDSVMSEGDFDYVDMAAHSFVDVAQQLGVMH